MTPLSFLQRARLKSILARELFSGKVASCLISVPAPTATRREEVPTPIDCENQALFKA